MEPKKNPVYDVHRYRSIIFAIGLMTSLSIVIMAFEWTSEVHHFSKHKLDQPMSELIYTVPITDHLYASRSIVKPVQVPLDFVEVSKEPVLPSEELIVEGLPPDEPTEVMNLPIEVPVEVANNDPVIFAEVMPEPVGGYAGFYESLKKLMKYPRKAQQLEIDGKVFIEFVVNEEGNLNNLKVVKGIGGGCDEEAMRVLSLTKWKPGKQRGKPVKVRMVLPINFLLTQK